MSHLKRRRKRSHIKVVILNGKEVEVVNGMYPGEVELKQWIAKHLDELKDAYEEDFGDLPDFDYDKETDIEELDKQLTDEQKRAVDLFLK